MHSLWKNKVEKLIPHDPIELAFLSTNTYPYFPKKLLAVRQKKIKLISDAINKHVV